MTRDEMLASWRAKGEEWARLGITANAALLVERILADVEAVFRSEGQAALSLAEAAEASGYSRDHLARLVREGKLPNVGRRGAPRVRAGDLPKRTPLLPAASERNIIANRRRIALAVATPDIGANDG